MSAFNRTRAVQILDDTLRPRIKPGEYVLTVPDYPYATGDEVLLVTTDGRCTVRAYVSSDDNVVVFDSINTPGDTLTTPVTEIESIEYVSAITRRTET